MQCKMKEHFRALTFSTCLNRIQFYIEEFQITYIFQTRITNFSTERQKEVERDGQWTSAGP